MEWTYRPRRQVSAIEFVLPDGSRRAYDRSAAGDSDAFEGVAVGLGCLGPISQITLDLTPRYNVVQAVYIDISLASVLAHFRDMVNSVDSFSWLVDWPQCLYRKLICRILDRAPT